MVYKKGRPESKLRRRIWKRHTTENFTKKEKGFIRVWNGYRKDICVDIYTKYIWEKGGKMDREKCFNMYIYMA